MYDMSSYNDMYRCILRSRHQESAYFSKELGFLVVLHIKKQNLKDEACLRSTSFVFSNKLISTMKNQFIVSDD